MQVNSRERVPQDIKETRLEDLPPAYLNPIYICPNSIQLNIYVSKVTLQEPLDLDKIHFVREV